MADKKVLKAVGQAANSSSPDAAFAERGYSVERHALNPVEAPARTASDYSVVIHLSAPANIEWYCGRRSGSAQLPTGGVSLHSIGELPGFRLASAAELLEISLSPLFAQQSLRDNGPNARPEWKSVYGVDDPQARHIGLALWADKQAGCPGGRLFGDSLALALTTHLFRAYETDASVPPALQGRLSRPDSRRVEDYIRAHLGDDITLDALASLTLYSPHHFALLFRRTFGVSPHQYVIQARVEEARRLLAVSSLTLAEIAYQAGFANQSHFGLYFKRLVGATPRQYRAALH